MKIFSKHELDEVDKSILEESLSARMRFSRPLVGDFVELPDGSLRRISVIHQDGDLQLSGEGSFNITTDGICDYSGRSGYGLLKIEDLRPAGTNSGEVKFFHHREAKHDNLITVTGIHFRTWAIK